MSPSTSSQPDPSDCNIEAHSNFGIPRYDRVPLDTNTSVNPAQSQTILPVVNTEEVNMPNEVQNIPKEVQNSLGPK